MFLIRCGLLNFSRFYPFGAWVTLASIMTDPRYTKLAKLLIEYSTQLKKGERVLLDMIDVPDEFSVEMMRAARAVGATPLIEVRHGRVNREILRGTSEAHAGLVRDLELARMKKARMPMSMASGWRSTPESPGRC
jgi:leucyl aminopeptidase (aminopeptidase T)